MVTLKSVRLLCAVAPFLVAAAAQADVVTDWNARASEIVTAHNPGPAGQAPMALIQVAVFEAVNTVTRRYPKSGRLDLSAEPGTSIDAAVATINRSVLTRFATSQGPAIAEAYRVAMAAVPDGPAKNDGMALGEKAVAGIMALRNAPKGPVVPYRPLTTPGVYVPTVVPAGGDAPVARCWVLERPDQFRPGPPVDLKSATWARDYNEIKALGGQVSQRTAEQTDIARFWTTNGPTVYYWIVRSVADQSGRDLTQNARLLSASAQAMQDAVDAVFDAKHAYNFWRPFTAIRNGDQDGNDATERDAAWVPFIETPMHPEYPCAHCTVAAAMIAVLRAEVGNGAVPRLVSASPTLPGTTRSWTRLDDVTQEVNNARIYDGVHFRFSTEVGSTLGTQVGGFVAARLLR